jgi:hypothetical protein
VTWLTIFYRTDEFLQYFEHVTSLGFDETPNYLHLKGLFKQLFLANGFTYEAILFDWEVLALQQQQQQQHHQKQHQQHHYHPKK